MKAWQFEGAGKPLSLKEVAEPVVGAGELAIAVRAVGLCHTDVGILEGVIPESILAPLPLTLGHEVAGVVSGLGPGVKGFAVGDRVALHMSTAGPGMGTPGGYAATAVIAAERVAHVPDGVGFAEAAAGTDAGMTPFHAVKTIGAVTAGTRVGIVGLGGLGFNGAQVALALGAEVYAAEPRESVHNLARELGVTEIVTDVTGLAAYDLDVIVDFAGFGATTAGAVEAVKQGGRVVLVGAGSNEMTVSTIALIQGEVTLAGASGGSLDDLAGYYELVEAGLVKPVVSTIGFDDIADGLGRVERREVQGRLVAIFDNSRKA